MGYTFTCDACQTRHDSFPPFAGEFTETFLNTHGGEFAEYYDIGQKVTICPGCMEDLVL